MAERSFKGLDVNVYRVGPPSLVDIVWQWEDTTIPSSRYSLDVFRGESPKEMDRIAKKLPADQYQNFIDTTAYLKDKHRTYYYQVKAFNNETGKCIESPIQTWEGNLDYVGLYIVEEHDFLFKEVSGMPILIYKKITAGKARCECWDTVAKRGTRSNCKSCYGTTWVGDGVGGYYNPIYTYANLEPDPEQVNITQFGRAEPTQTDVFMSNYPRATVGDLFVELMTNKRWKVATVRDTEKNRVKMLQFVRLDGIEKGDIEYKLDVPDEFVARARKEINERKAKPEY